jgi:phage terminase large subunit-like protein
MLEIEARDRVPYSQWVRDGFINATEGNVVDYGFVKKTIMDCLATYQVQEIAYDRWNSSHMVQELIAEGDINMVPIGMGFGSMNAPTKYLEALILDKKIYHGANPVLRWNFDNVAIKTDPAGNIKPDKEKSTQKIDGIVALIMALDRVMRNENQVSIYETQGIKVF